MLTFLAYHIYEMLAKFFIKIFVTHINSEYVKTMQVSDLILAGEGV